MIREADPAEILRLELATGLYQPKGDYLSKCPRCGGVAVSSHEAHDFVDADPLCGACALLILEASRDHMSDEWKRMTWECCQLWDDGEDHCRVSGCSHRFWRREAKRLWRVDAPMVRHLDLRP